MISQKLHVQKLHKRASRLQWILGRFDFFTKLLEMNKNHIEERPLRSPSRLGQSDLNSEVTVLARLMSYTLLLWN